MTFIRHFLLAVQFFTRIPVTGRLAQWVGFSQQALRASAAHFPGVGWLVGGIVATLAFGLLAVLPATAGTALLVAALTTVASVMITGAFHEDGLADVADGLGGSLDPVRSLEIMKDSRVGAFGALALVLAVTSKLALLAVMGAAAPTALPWAMLAAHVCSRFFPLLLIRTLPHVGDGDGSKSKPLADAISARALLAALVWCLALWPLMAWLGLAAALPAALAAATLACLWMWRMFARRLKGFTGDCLGATQQVCELAFYLGWLLWI